MLIFVAGFFSVVLSLNASAQNIPPEGFTALFNGVDLDIFLYGLSLA